MSNITEQAAILRIGEVYSINGRTIRVKVDENKNVSHLLYCGTILKNVSVGSFIKILKGFIKIIAKVEGEQMQIDKDILPYKSSQDVLHRYLEVKLLGYIDNGKYYQGIKEMPLVGNTCQLMLNDEFDLIHSFTSDKNSAITIGNLLLDEEQPISLGINDLFGSHIGVFGNTGSGKSYTLTKLYHQLFLKVGGWNRFKENARYIFFDFNGEYSAESTITPGKQIYKLSTSKLEPVSRLPIAKSDFTKSELISILANATEKTQQPFVKRALKLYDWTFQQETPLDTFKSLLRRCVIGTLRLEDSVKGNLLLSYIEQILSADNELVNFRDNIGFYTVGHCFTINNQYLNNAGAEAIIMNSDIYKAVDNYKFQKNHISLIIDFLYLQLMKDVLANRAINEHIAPVINRLKGVQKGFERIFEIREDDKSDLYGDSNIAVIDMNDVNTEMKKIIPLIISQKAYNIQKQQRNVNNDTSLNIIIDEAHNILSAESIRESEAWKDYRLEVFEEIIKEGRKFGVFLTIASQRPSDISHTIISQLHNYFIHRLVNQRDIDMVANNVSYLDRLSVEQLPVLPQGGCVVAGVMLPLPVIIKVASLDKVNAPVSTTIDLIKAWKN